MALPTRDALRELPGAELLTAFIQCVMLATLGPKQAGITEFEDATKVEIGEYMQDLKDEVDLRVGPYRAMRDIG